MSSLLSLSDKSKSKASARTEVKRTKKSSSRNTQKASAKKSSVMAGLSSGPKKLYSGTKAMVTGKSSAAPTVTKKPVPKKSWFGPEPPKQPRTVNEWMAQKRLDP